MAKSILSWKDNKVIEGRSFTSKTASASLENPKAVRRDIQTAYERYVLGTDRFPRIKIAGIETTEDITRFPYKTQPAVRALAQAWALIDEDEAWWADSLGMLNDMVATKVEAGSFDAPMCSIVRVGCNVVRVGILEPSENLAVTGPLFEVNTYRTEEFMQRFEGAEFNLFGDRKIRIEDGLVTGDASDLAVVRGSNVGLLYAPQLPSEPVAV